MTYKILENGEKILRVGDLEIVKTLNNIYMLTCKSNDKFLLFNEKSWKNLKQITKEIDK